MVRPLWAYAHTATLRTAHAQTLNASYDWKFGYGPHNAKRIVKLSWVPYYKSDF